MKINNRAFPAASFIKKVRQLLKKGRLHHNSLMLMRELAAHQYLATPE
jgi:hypothetical protein